MFSFLLLSCFPYREFRISEKFNEYENTSMSSWISDTTDIDTLEFLRIRNNYCVAGTYSTKSLKREIIQSLTKAYRLENFQGKVIATIEFVRDSFSVNNVVPESLDDVFVSDLKKCVIGCTAPSLAALCKDDTLVYYIVLDFWKDPMFYEKDLKAE